MIINTLHIRLAEVNTRHSGSFGNLAVFHVFIGLIASVLVILVCVITSWLMQGCSLVHWTHANTPVNYWDYFSHIFCIFPSLIQSPSVPLGLFTPSKPSVRIGLLAAQLCATIHSYLYPLSKRIYTIPSSNNRVTERHVNRERFTTVSK